MLLSEQLSSFSEQLFGILRGGGGGACTPLALARGGVLFFMISKKLLEAK